MLAWAHMSTCIPPWVAVAQICWDPKDGFLQEEYSKAVIPITLIKHVMLELTPWKMTRERSKTNGLVQSNVCSAKCCEQGINNLFFGLFQAVFFQSADINRGEHELCLSKETGACRHIITCHTQKRIAPRTHLWPREWAPAGHGVHYTNECFECPYTRHSSEDMTVHRGQWEQIGSLWL